MIEFGENSPVPHNVNKLELSLAEKAQQERRLAYSDGLNRRFSQHPDGTPLQRHEIPDVIRNARLEAIETLEELMSERRLGIVVDEERIEHALLLLGRAQEEKITFIIQQENPPNDTFDR